MSYSTVRASLRSVLFHPPETFDKRDVLLSALFLTVLLAVFVPIVAVSTGVPILALVVVAGLVYAAGLLLTDTVFEGLCGAMFVLCTFAANLPLLEQPTVRGIPIQLDFLMVDFVVIPLAVLLLYWDHDFSLVPDRRLERVVGYTLAGVVAWSVLAALINNGPSRFGAAVFLTMQVRYLLLFGVAVYVVRYTGLRTALYSFLVALGGHIAYALAEVLNRGSFGLSYLGDAGGVTIDSFPVGPFVFPSSMYAGGFVGNSRALTMLIILLLPIVVERIVNGSRVQRLLAVPYVLGGAFIVRTSGSDASWVAFLFAMLGAVFVLTYIGFDTDVLDSVFETVDYLYGYACALGASVLVIRLFSNRTGTPSLDAEGGAGASSGAGAEGGAGASSGAGANTEVALPEFVVDLLNTVPFVNTGTLQVRLEQYVAAVEIAITYPLFGLGGGNFLYVAKSYGMARPVEIHNAYLYYLAAIGFPGALLFLGALVAVWLIAVRRTLRRDTDRLLWGMIACGLIGFYAYAFWTSGHLVDPTFMTFWVLAGLLVGARWHDRQHTPDTTAA